jgi:hypothetical protein
LGKDKNRKADRISRGDAEKNGNGGRIGERQERKNGNNGRLGKDKTEEADGYGFHPARADIETI